MKFLPLYRQNWYDKNVFDFLTENSDSTNESDSDEKGVENCITAKSRLSQAERLVYFKIHASPHAPPSHFYVTRTTNDIRIGEFVIWK